jgi:hypothetical protein
MDEVGEQSGDAPRVRVLKNVSAEDQSSCSEFEETCNPRQKDWEVSLTTASHKNGAAGCHFDDAYIVLRTIGWIGLDDVGSELGCLADERRDSTRIAIDLIAVPRVRKHDERLDHQWHAVPLALRLEAEDVTNACMMDARAVRQQQQIHYHACGVKPERLFDDARRNLAEEHLGQSPSVDVGDIGPHHQRRLMRLDSMLKQRRVPDAQLNRIQAGLAEIEHKRRHVANAVQEALFVEQTMVYRHVHAAPISRE